jgi:hypothetical protein
MAKAHESTLIIQCPMEWRNLPQSIYADPSGPEAFLEHHLQAGNQRGLQMLHYHPSFLEAFVPLYRCQHGKSEMKQLQNSISF